MSTESEGHRLARRTGVVMGVVTLVLGAWLLLWHAFSFVLLLFAGVLFGVFLDGAVRLLDARLPAPRKGILVAVVVVLAGALGTGLWLLGPALGTQLAALAETLPGAAAEVEAWLARRGWGRQVLERLPTGGGGGGAGAPASMDLFGRVTGFFSSTLSLLTNALVVAFLGVYFAASPELYHGPLVRLVPPARRERAREVLEAAGAALRSWLGGRLASMGVVAVLTGVGLFVLGVPLALGLALLAGLLSFVPFLGPLVSAVPALLVAFVERPTLALWVAGLYAFVQFVESYLVTPLIQQRAVSLPPSALLASQILLGIMGGLLGVLLATPLAVVAVVVVQALYVGDVLGEEVELVGS